MVQTTNKNLKIVKEFKRKLSKKININKVILFGSRARGDFNQDRKVYKYVRL